MAAEGRGPDSSLIGRLAARPQGFELLAAVLVLEAGGVGRIRYRAPLMPVFPAADVEALMPDPRPAGTGTRAASSGSVGAGGDALVETSVMSLFGPNGPLPAPLAESLRERVRSGDAGGRAFLDIFGGRLTELLVAALRREHPSTARQAPALSEYGRVLLALAGDARYANAPTFMDRVLMGNSGLLHQRPQSAHALSQMLRGHLGVPASTEGLVGGWTPLARSARARLSASGRRAAVLGGGGALGSRVWLQDGAVRLDIGPMPGVQYRSLLPGTEGHEGLRGLAIAALPPQVDIRARFRVRASEVPCAALDEATLLGWTSWLGRPPDGKDGVASISLRGRARPPVRMARP